MPTLWSQTLIPTSRQDPAETEAPSHRLMIRAGLIRQLGAGVYSYLPAGWRSLHKAIEIIREEMNAAGAAELLMPALEPLEIFAETKRDVDYGDNLFRVKDRHGRMNALGPTHEEVITEAMRAYVSSWRQLPLNLYQIQMKFRDEFRPRFGVLRSREFIMKDAYSFHLEIEGPGGLNEGYDAMYDAYCRIFDRCGLSYEIVEAESGPIGGSASHEFIVCCETGEDTILISDDGTYAANVEKCAIGPRTWSFDGAPTGEIEEVHTPDMPGIDEVGKFMKVKPRNMLKTLVCRRNGAESGGWVLAVVRGDHDLNEGKLKDACAFAVEMANDAEAKAAGFAIGFVSPRVLNSIDGIEKVVIDPDAAQDQFWATGADKIDYHIKHFNWKRDVGTGLESDKVIVADIRNALDGDPAPHDGGGTLNAKKGIEVGHVFKLGTKYSEAMGFTVADEQQQSRPVIMGCYGIGAGRIIASAIETSFDDDGIIWPAAIAPWTVHIVPIKWAAELRQTAVELAAALEQAGIDCLIDDRDERPGPKFKDADLLGCPVRITIGDKALADGCVEMKLRRETGSKGELVKIEDVVDRVRGVIRE